MLAETRHSLYTQVLPPLSSAFQRSNSRFSTAPTSIFYSNSKKIWELFAKYGKPGLKNHQEIQDFLDSEPCFLQRFKVQDLKKLDKLLDSNQEYLEDSEKKEKKRLFRSMAITAAFYATHYTMETSCYILITNDVFFNLALDTCLLLPAAVTGLVLCSYRGLDVHINKKRIELNQELKKRLSPMLEQKELNSLKTKPFQKSDLPTAQV